MAKQVKIKDIAEMAGVSAGTVDRVLHNRGKVSEKNRIKVEQVLEEVGYKMNIHASAISFRKEFKIVIAIPTFSPGEYWGSIRNGIEEALREYADINIHCVWYPYNQYDVYSCRTTFETVLELSPDAVIIGPTFSHETEVFCQELDRKAIPYVFVDSFIEGTSPRATFTVDQEACGRLLAHLLLDALPQECECAILNARRIGSENANNSILREKGFSDYMREMGKEKYIHHMTYSNIVPEENAGELLSFFKEHPNVRIIAIMNSRGYVLADVLSQYHLEDIKIVCFDMTAGNVKCLQDGRIAFLLCQNPERQGFMAVRSIINYLLYRQPEKDPHHYLPIDVILKENLPYYSI